MSRRHFVRVYGRMGPDFWARIMWSDECSFDTSRGTTKWVIHMKGERYHPACCESVFKLNSTSIPIWGAIGYNRKSPLVFLEGHGKRGGDDEELQETGSRGCCGACVQ